MELGSGAGNFLVGLAQRQIEDNYLGIELRYKRCFRTLQKAQIHGVNNIYVLRYNCTLIGELFAPTSVRAFYLNFPDPWEKRRQKKNRIFSAAFLQSIACCLEINGHLQIKTDHREYFEQILDIIESDKRLKIRELSFDLYNSLYLENNIRTEFEGMYRNEGAAVNYLVAERMPD
ncbi:MAG: tRNA (guanosine(46)-N7)-methyltransferase TrmB [Deltaproteobacteria bacterium]|nr:tRNA (guanosine(46)-N7)-methyltransferase TrmB [Deltaproteobacteria bacterium]